MRDILFTCLEIAIIYTLTFLLLWFNTKAFSILKRSNFLNNSQSIFKKAENNIRFIIIIVSSLATLFVLGFNFWLFYHNKSVQAYTINLIQQVPRKTWINLGLGIVKTIMVFWLIFYINKGVVYGLKKACVFAQDFDDIKENDESVAKFFDTAEVAIKNCFWLIGCNITLIFFNLPETIIQVVYRGIKIYIIFSIGILILKSVSIIVETLDNLSLRLSQSSQIFQIYQKFRHLLGFFRRCLETAVAVSFTTFAIRQIEVLANLAIFGEKLVKVVAIVFLSRIVVEISKLIIERLMFVDENKNTKKKDYQMKSTFLPLIESVVKYLIFFFTGIFILYALGINPLPILAAAGILGVGISLGAQTLVKDIIAGFFILFEGDFLVGDFVKIGQFSGYVQSIELRTTTIRSIEGHHQIIRNGDIDQIINYTKESWNKLIVEFGVSYKANLDIVYKIVEEIGEELAATNPNVLEKTKIRRIEEFRKHDILISTITTIIPDTAIGVSGQLRKLLKERLETAGIEQPYAKNMIFNGFGEN